MEVASGKRPAETDKVSIFVFFPKLVLLR